MKKIFSVLLLIIVSTPIVAMNTNNNIKNIIDGRNEIILHINNAVHNNQSNTHISQADVENMVDVALTMDQQRRNNNDVLIKEYKQKMESKARIYATLIVAPIACIVVYIVLTIPSVILIANGLSNGRNSTSSF